VPRVIVALLALLVLTPAAAAAPTPYGTDNVPGFRNVLPPGAKGTDNALELAAFTAAGSYPAHWLDQQPLYENLLYASPSLTHEQIDDYFKDATFGVKESDVESTTTPRDGVTIIRDKGYGVPHIYGDTRGDVLFGEGYAGAQDRLFLMDVLRHTGRAQLSSFVGGSAGNRAMDRTQWALAPYTEADLQKQIDLADEFYGAEGAQLQADLREYVAGINAYIAAARNDPTLMPGEYAAFGKSVEDWKGTDVIATASLIGGIFGKGGGREVRSALAMQAFTKRFGPRRGRRAWLDFRSKNDPEAPTTVDRKRFPYQTASPFSKRGLALPDRGSVKFTPVAPPAAGRRADRRSFGSALLRSAESPPHASNWEIVNAKESATGHPIGVLGPQVGYYVPQILMEQDIHGGGFDARGATFPGVNVIVQLGHGTDYAWSATTADTDNVDTFAEVLCQDDFHYRYKGDCLAMEKLERTNAWTPSVGDDTPAGSETLTAYRTVHGIVYARGKVGGKPVAFTLARTTYFHEADSALGFICLNQPACVHSPASFRRAVNDINFGFNWAYIDAEHTAYQQSGWYPRRAKGTSPDFPILGTGKYDWQGYDPERHTQKVLTNKERPHVVDQPFTVSWNGKQARGWAAADDEYFWGSLQRQQMIQAFVRRATKGPRKIRLEQLVQAMEEPATQDIRGLYDLPVALRALGPVSGDLGKAVATLKAWHKAGAHRRDLDKDGVYDDDAAVTLMDAWWPKLAQAIFKPALGAEVVSKLRDVVPIDAELEPGRSPSAPAFSTGWYGYVHKDLRDLFTPKRVRGRWSRVYCGDGSKAKCRAAIRKSLEEALTVKKGELYGTGDCASNAQASCFDMNRPTVASAVSSPPFPFQNRPTFQQTVELTQKLPR
jgi:acyl-homoserine lactone acylase PvdQ